VGFSGVSSQDLRVPPTGIEPVTYGLGIAGSGSKLPCDTSKSEEAVRSLASRLASDAASGGDLCRVILAWPDLPKKVRRAVLKLIHDTAGGPLRTD
jgi:hypothetical protein